MKIYTDEQEYNKDLLFWSDNIGLFLFNPHKNVNISIKDEELPAPLQPLLDYLGDGYGMYPGLAEYNGRYGLVLMNEYYEGEKEEPDINNYEQAVKAAEKIESAYPKFPVIIGKQVGFPFTLKDGTVDKATELIVFIDAEYLSQDDNKAEFDECVNFIYENAYIPSATLPTGKMPSI